ncbi:MAG: shikimate kinase [Paracoccaceae bacterium]
MTLRMPVVLVGMMGAGKSAIGSALAHRLSVTHVDSDDEIVKAANMSISEIFDRDGEIFFRKREEEVLSRILDDSPKVVSTGGGAFVSSLNRKLISSKGVSVWLKADVTLLWSRLRLNKTRPLLRKSNPLEFLTQLNQDREKFYGMADLCFHIVEEYKVNESAELLHKELRKNFNFEGI